MATASMSQQATGRRGATGEVTQIIGVVVDVAFPPDQLPEIYNAVEINLTPQNEEP